MSNPREQMVAEAIWTTIHLAYKEPGDRTTPDRFEMPVHEAVNALLTCLAQAIGSVDDAQAREQILRNVMPALERAIAMKRARPQLMLPRGPGIVLPN